MVRGFYLFITHIKISKLQRGVCGYIYKVDFVTVSECNDAINTIIGIIQQKEFFR